MTLTIALLVFCEMPQAFRANLVCPAPQELQDSRVAQGGLVSVARPAVQVVEGGLKTT
jgi:hypothetical protein